MNFAGFDRRAIALPARLPTFDERRFASVRDLLASGLRQPGAALIEVVAKAVDPQLATNPRHSVCPLHRDLRFAKAGTPRYKNHLLLTTWTGSSRKAAPTLWIRLDVDSVGFATGIAFSPQVRDRWRDAVGGPRGAALVRHIEAISKKHARHSVDLAGDTVRRVPKPWPEDHPRVDFLRRTGFQLRFREAIPKALDQPAFVTWCAERLKDLLPIHQWLVAELPPKGARR